MMPAALRESTSRNDQRVARVSLAAMGTRVDWASSASASMLSALIGSSNHDGANGSSAWKIDRAVGTSHSP
jgi:hypothetical protein